MRPNHFPKIDLRQSIYYRIAPNRGNPCLRGVLSEHNEEKILWVSAG